MCHLGEGGRGGGGVLGMRLPVKRLFKGVLGYIRVTIEAFHMT